MIRRSMLLMLLTACGGTDPEATTPRGSSPATPATTPVTEYAPTPFTADEIREGCPSGRRHLFAERTPAGTTRRETHFIESTPEGARIEIVTLNDDGTTGEPQLGEATWEELRLHARYPAAQTTITAEEITVPFGTFVTKRYTVDDPEAGTLTRVWFADDLPGPPIRLIVEQGGVEALHLEMQSLSFPEP